MLPLKEAINKLSFHRAEAAGAGDTQLDTQTQVAGGSFGVEQWQCAGDAEN